MSISGLSDPDKSYKKSIHRRNDSGELDVFEAARYFSGASEVLSGYNGATFTHKNMRGGRISLDVPMRNLIPSQTHHVMEKQMMKEKKLKQPSSPGGRLASFLNSLFNQTSSKKKKSKSSATKEEDESPGGRRKRRSSISHFRSTSTVDSKTLFSSSSSSGFRTPPPYANTPTKMIYKDLRSYSDHKPLSKYNNIGHVKSTSTDPLQNEVCGDKRSTDYAWLDDKFNFTNGFSEKNKNLGNGFSEKERIWADKYPSEKEFIKFNEVDDGADSDSSSDLFELQNYDLGYCSSGLPVYETTHMDSIKRGAPISNGPI
uniref:Protein BIG GRAIN 1-like E n=1 Tax=Davidia involucrata TaxID=16924 RepID=A0A5B6ZWJ9_DAVIN